MRTHAMPCICVHITFDGVHYQENAQLSPELFLAVGGVRGCDCFSPDYSMDRMGKGRQEKGESRPIIRKFNDTQRQCLLCRLYRNMNVYQGQSSKLDPLSLGSSDGCGFQYTIEGLALYIYA